MRPSASERRALVIAALGVAACSAARTPDASPILAATSVAPPPASEGDTNGRTRLAEPRDVALPFVLEQQASGVLAIASDGDAVSWVRRVDGASPGPLVKLVGERVVATFDRTDGATTWVTSDGTHLCFALGPPPATRTCAEASPSAIVPVGDRLALLEVRHVAGKGGGARASQSKPKDPPREPKGKAHAKKASHASKKKASGHAAAPHVTHPIVELLIRWVEPSLAIASEPQATDLHFEAPLDGMTLAGARARAPGIDVLWYETAPSRKTRAPLGSGRLMAGSLRADGSLDFGSRVAVVDADVEFGRLKDYAAPRLVGTTASTFLALDAKGACQAMVVRPTLSRPLAVTPATCAIAPDRVADARPADEAAFARILADDPRRAFAAPRGEPGLVAWGSARAYYLHGLGLRSASPTESSPRDEPSPFVARRAGIAWGSIAEDGEALASVDGHLVHVAIDGAVTTAAAEGDIPGAVRIGATWWTARGPRRRLFPDPAPPLAGARSPDVSVLVGGASTGLALELAAGSLRVELVDSSGTATPLSSVAPARVSVGFDACTRGRGGAIVAGVSTNGQVMAFAIDGSGTATDARVVPLPLVSGELAVRLVPLPGGGALLRDLERRHVVWLDDDARVTGSAPWPSAESDATCAYGRRMRLDVPSATPNELANVPGVATGACLVGDAVWTRDGSLRWFGGATNGLDFVPELASVAIGVAASPPAVEPTKLPSPLPTFAPRPCPSEMVDVGGKLCVDRFEATILDARTGHALSPDYPMTPNLLDAVLAEWSTGRERVGSVHARALPLPWLAPGRVGDRPTPLAVPRLGARPNGYLTGIVAAAACAEAGKRLCTLDEFVTACRGEADTAFPYGDSYVDGACNVFREEHPAALLHDNASMGHLDPRLNRVRSHGRPLLQLTGQSPACKSRWGDDAIYDMVGNLDEWVDEGGGAFAGGFYSRSTRSGCDAVVTNHPKTYVDYSTGVRCCKDRM